MKRKTLILMSLTLMMILLAAGISYAVSPEQQASICAEDNLSSYLGMIAGDAQNFHFSSEADLKKAYLGKPVSHIQIAYLDFDPDKKLKDQARDFAFYHFPVKVDDKVITDFTVCLEDGKWKPVDIGGHLCSVIDEEAKNNNIAYKDSVILHFAGEMYVVVNKGGEEFCYLPYNGSDGIAKRKLVSADIFKEKVMQERLDSINYVKQMQALSPDDPISTGSFETQPLPIKQASITTRLHNYITHVLSFR